MELTKIKGVSDKRKEDFEKLSVLDTDDLIRFFPRNYLDLRVKQLLKYAYHNDVVLTVGRLISSPVVLHFRRGGHECPSLVGDTRLSDGRTTKVHEILL